MPLTLCANANPSDWHNPIANKIITGSASEQRPSRGVKQAIVLLQSLEHLSLAFPTLFHVITCGELEQGVLEAQLVRFCNDARHQFDRWRCDRLALASCLCRSLEVLRSSLCS